MTTNKFGYATNKNIEDDLVSQGYSVGDLKGINFQGFKLSDDNGENLVTRIAAHARPQRFSMASVGSIGTRASAASLTSLASVASTGSVNVGAGNSAASSGSIASVASSASIASVGAAASAGSVASIAARNGRFIDYTLAGVPGTNNLTEKQVRDHEVDWTYLAATPDSTVASTIRKES
jgi:hypothetical protein